LLSKISSYNLSNSNSIAHTKVETISLIDTQVTQGLTPRQMGLLSEDTAPNHFCPSAFSTDNSYPPVPLLRGRLLPEEVFGGVGLPPAAK
jgi:hypothetical protein